MKILATDLDGTLFYPKDKKEMICKENLTFVRDFIEQGNKLVIVTGRSLAYGKQVARRINRNVTLVCYNGAIINEDDVDIYDFSIPNDVAKEIINQGFESTKIKGAFIMTENGVFVRTRSNNILFRRISEIFYESQKVYAEKFNIDPKSYEYELNFGKIHKIMFFFGIMPKSKSNAREYNKILREEYEFMESSWSNNAIEITNRQCSKGNAILKYICIKGISKEDVYVVGDSGNDISMFKEFKENSFCMSHAHRVVKKYSNNIIDKFVDLKKWLF